MIILIFQFFFILIFQPAACAEKNMPRKHLIVEFNPYVSVLDFFNQNRYNISQLVPMVAKVATEFDQIIIDLKDTLESDGSWKKPKFPPDLSSSLLLSPLAVARYNTRLNSSQPKLEVWLAHSPVSPRFNSIDILRHLKYIAEKANDIYESTVTTILLGNTRSFNENVLQMTRNEREYKTFIFKRAYKWGVVVRNAICGRQQDTIRDSQDTRRLNASVAVLKIGIDKLSANLSSECKQYKASNDLTFWFHPEDTNRADATSFVDQWNLVQKFAERNDVPIVVSRAFDVSCESISRCRVGLHEMKSGWWRLSENPDYTSTTQYVFKATAEIAQKTDRDVDSFNLTAIEKSERNLTRKHLGICFSLANFRKANALTQIQVAESLAVEGVLSAVTSSYSKILITLTNKEITDELTISHLAKQLLKNVEIILFVDLNVISTELIKAATALSAINNNLTFAIEFHKELTNAYHSNHLLIRNLSSWDTKIINVFSISLCAQFEMLSDASRAQVIEALDNSNFALFSFAEDVDTINLGAERMFQRRLVTFAQCKRFLTKAKSISTSTIVGNIEMGFIMRNYESPSKYYEDANALYNFVLYWGKLREWASSSETTMIMSGVIDSVITGYNNRLNLGWWRYLPRIETTSSNFTPQWIDKKTELLRYADIDKYVGDKYLLSTTHFIIISVPILVLAFVGIFVTYFVSRKHHRQKFASTEVNEFFHGNQNSNELSSDDPTKLFTLPYDKSKFEIGPKSFVINHSRVLGSGEFGMVCLGKVEKSVGTFVDVAVKMANSNKCHKSMLSSLLSEIKVLAHVGKHENVIELLGAFTGDLKRGKIFVFLELCQCGSLEKYLRDIRPEESCTDGDFSDEVGVELTEIKRYVNAAAKHSNVLDAELSHDLYRWSMEICSGMSFLASKHVVHADLATRNVLLNLGKTAKICDFGLSRKMYNYENYAKKGQDPLPWKWMPPESLILREFNEKSDVWAFGITLWEIYSLGATPYPGLSWDHNFPQMLEKGFRMSKPKYNDRNMYLMMKKCWHSNPLGRPSFADLLLLFGNEEIVD